MKLSLSDVCNSRMLKYLKKPLSKTHSKYFLDLLSYYDEKLASMLYYGAISYDNFSVMVGTEYEYECLSSNNALNPQVMFECLILEGSKMRSLLELYYMSNADKHNCLFIPVLVKKNMLCYVCTFQEKELLEYLNISDAEEIYEKYPVLLAILNWGITYMIYDNEEEMYNDILATDIEQSENYIQIKSNIVSKVFKEKWLPYPSTLHAIAGWNYEHQANYGFIDFAAPLSINDKNLHIKFKEPFIMSAHEARTIRKYVELSNDSLRLKANSSRGFIYGPSLPDDVYWHFVGLGEKEEKSYATIRFEGKSSWRMLFENESVFYDGSSFTLQREHKKIPEYANATVAFYRELEMATGKYSQEIVENINSIISMAKKQLHGTMIVFSPNAKSEAERLCQCGRGIKIEPINFIEIMKADKEKAKQIMFNLTKIDGSMFFDEYGVCYSIGTIVDGRACKNSNPGRGARYNSGYTYVHDCNMREIQCYCIVISEDETIDVFGQFGQTVAKKIQKIYRRKSKWHKNKLFL